MSRYSTLKAAFQYGEISPYFGGQVGSDIYSAGVMEMRNVLPDRHGGFRKRNGTVYMAAPDGAKRTRLFELYTGAASYILAMNTDNTYLYASDTLSLMCSVPTPYSTFEEIQEVKARANKGVLYLVHRSYAPKTLTVTISGSTHTMAYADISFVSYADEPDRSVTFSGAGNYPSALCFKGGRLFLAATDNRPTTVWASRVPDVVDRYNDFTMYDNIYIETADAAVAENKKYYSKSYDSAGEAVFSRVTPEEGDVPKDEGWYEWYNYDIQSSHAFELEENDMYGTRIHWMAVQNRIICGNRRAVFMDTGDISSPSSFDMTVSLNTGSSALQARCYKNYVLFLGSNGKQLYLLVWDDDIQNYSAIEITQNASHLFRAGIADFDIMLDPELIIWVITNDGELLSCSMATGWASHPRAAGTYTSLAVAGESHFRLFLEVRTGASHHLEYLDISDDPADGVFTDCSTVFSLVSPSQAVPVNGVLEDCDVSAFADGVIMPYVTAEKEGGTVYANYDKAVRAGYIGLPIESSVRLFPPEIPANGTSMGKTKRISVVTLRMYESFGGSVSVDDGESVRILTERYGTARYGDVLRLSSEDVTLSVMGRNTKKGIVNIRHGDPVPFSVLSVGTGFELVEV